MIDYIGILIGLVIFVALLIYEFFDRKKHKDTRFEYLTEISDKLITDTNKDESYLKYDDESIKTIELLESLAPFDHPIGEPAEFSSKDCILEYRDIIRNKYHGIQGWQLIRQRRVVTIAKDQYCNMFPEWHDIGPVKKEL